MIAGLLIAAVLFGVTAAVFYDRYYSHIYGGFSNYSQVFEKILNAYDEGKTDKAFVNIMCSIYQADYIRLAKVEDDGSFDVIYETRYDVVPVDFSLKNWVFLTDDEALLTENDGHLDSEVQGFNIEYKRCDEIGKIDYVVNPYFVNSYLLMWQNMDFIEYDPYYWVSRILTDGYYPETRIETYYIEGDTFHIGKATTTSILKKYGEWDFTDSSKADLYLVPEFPDGEGQMYVQYPVLFYDYVRPDEFLEKEKVLFQAQSWDEIALPSDDPKIISFHDSNEWYQENYEHDGRLTQGLIRTLDINGNKYLVEYIITSESYIGFFMPFFIVFAIVLLVLGIGIPLLAAVRPYNQYKTAYENNVFKNNLIDSLAHNLKTPLQILGGYAENLKDVNNEKDKNRYADQILAKTGEMNRDIEMILKTADKTLPDLTKGSVKEVFEEVASMAGIDIRISGDKEIPMDKDYFKQAIFCLLDNASRYKSEGSKIEVKISSSEIVISNKTSADKFTPGTGLAIAGRIIEQHKLMLMTSLKDGVFESKIAKK